MGGEMLIIGGGGREHALAWKLSQEKQGLQLYFASGNAGTEVLGGNLAIEASNSNGIAAWAMEHKPDMVVIGPEVPLALGIVDKLQESGIRVFGPTQRASEIEWSKAYAKEFMERYNIPTAHFEVFDNYSSACRYLESVCHPIVIKASGLAAGKGVVVSNTAAEAQEALQRIMEEKTFGHAGDVVVIEEHLSGPEVSVMAFTDGETVRPMIFVRDHKRLRSGNRGPNTGGMGAYCPVALDNETRWMIRTEILKRAVDGLRREGRPFQGILYAGVMLTDDGPKVLEFNSRFGDPEAQVLLPLLDTNLLEVMDAVTERQLHRVEIRWKNGFSVCVVLAAKGYPDKPETGALVHGLEGNFGNDVVIFQSGTERVCDRVVTSGGRVLGIVGIGQTLIQAQRSSYAPIGVGGIWFDGMQYRKDIASETYG